MVQLYTPKFKKEVSSGCWIFFGNKNLRINQELAIYVLINVIPQISIGDAFAREISP